jgi:flagellin
MSLYVNSNPASLEAQANLSRTQKALQGNIGRLSSGLRINQAADDAAGLGISEDLKAQIVGTQAASRNANDGISMTQIAEGAMNEQAAILNRLRSLAVQSANGTLAQTERGFINTEATQLTNELDRISAVTSFQGTAMLGANAGAVTMQVGANGTANDTIAVTFAKTDSTTLGVKYGVGTSVDLGTSATTAYNSIAKLDAGIAQLSTDRATVAAGQNRLNAAINNLASAATNLTAANSRIRDVDVASETAAMTSNQVLSQAGIAVLSQANQLPSSALSLLPR